MADRNPPADDQLAFAVPPPRRPATAPGDSVLIAEMGHELRAGFAALAAVERGVSLFGSAGTGPEDPDYELARAVAMRLGRDGFAIITGDEDEICHLVGLAARGI
jgi:hypothetical protein